MTFSPHTWGSEEWFQPSTSRKTAIKRSLRGVLTKKELVVTLQQLVVLTWWLIPRILAVLMLIPMWHAVPYSFPHDPQHRYLFLCRSSGKTTTIWTRWHLESVDKCLRSCSTSTLATMLFVKWCMCPSTGQLGDRFKNEMNQKCCWSGQFQPIYLCGHF